MFLPCNIDYRYGRIWYLSSSAKFYIEVWEKLDISSHTTQAGLKIWNTDAYSPPLALKSSLHNAPYAPNPQYNHQPTSLSPSNECFFFHWNTKYTKWYSLTTHTPNRHPSPHLSAASQSLNQHHPTIAPLCMPRIHRLAQRRSTHWASRRVSWSQRHRLGRSFIASTSLACGSWDEFPQGLDTRWRVSSWGWWDWAPLVEMRKIIGYEYRNGAWSDMHK